jgi:hypothetical protein
MVYPRFMDESSAAQNRKSNRTPVMLSATLEMAGQAQAVVLRNLSEGGALVEGKWLPAQGSMILFARNELRVPARVAWVEGTYAGVSFECRLDRSEVLRQVPKPKEKFEPQFRRPGLACRPLSEADRRMVQMWATPLPPQAD